MRRRRPSSSGFGRLGPSEPRCCSESPAAARRSRSRLRGLSSPSAPFSAESAPLNRRTEFLLCRSLRPSLRTASRVARVGPTTPKQLGGGKRSPIDGEKHTDSRGAARLLPGCFGRSDRSAQGYRLCLPCGRHRARRGIATAPRYWPFFRVTETSAIHTAPGRSPRMKWSMLAPARCWARN
jgi:hypothetical protein